MIGFDALSDIRAQIQRFAPNTSSAAAAIINDAINREYQSVCASHEWPQFERSDTSGLRDPSDAALATLEQADQFAPMPFSSGRLLSLHHQSAVAGITELLAKDPRAFSQTVGARFGESGVPAIYCFVGQTAQIRKAAAGAITAFCSVSTNNASGGSNKTVTVRYRRGVSVQLDQRSKINLNGQFSSGVPFHDTIPAGYPIESVSIPAGWAGTFRIVDSGGTDIVSWGHLSIPENTITGDKEVISRQLIEVWPTPSSDFPLTVHWYRDPLPLVADEDIPEIPVSGYLVDQVAGIYLQSAQRHKDATTRMERAATMLVRLKAQHRQSAPRVARPYGGNLLNATGVWY